MTVKITLDGTWKVRAENMDCIGEAGYGHALAQSDDWLAAQVPGEVHLDLIRAGKMAEPSVSHNAPDCRWPETHSWWFQRSLPVTPEFLALERQLLVFDGLDLFAQIFVNGQLAGSSANAFVPIKFNVKPFLRAGENELVVRMTVGSELAADATLPGQDAKPAPNTAAGGAIPNPGQRTWPGTKWLRKPQFSYGWDWSDALPNIGIWRSVSLEGSSYAVIDDIRLDTVMRDGQVLLELDAVLENLHPWSERPVTLTLEIAPPNGVGPTISRRYERDMHPGRVAIGDTMEIPGPQLWWPNGMGAQPLYDVAVSVLDSLGNVHDSRKFRIGLRTIDVDRSHLADGSRFCIRVNGQDVFCRGGNIGPHDMIPARISDAKYNSLVAEAKNANMNMLRINGCSVFDAPAFYDACDRDGILIWQDFMLTCTTYRDDIPAFVEAVRAECEAAVKMLRHHPSIALWCGNNECTWGFRDWWNPDPNKPLDLGGQKLYNQVIPDICRHLDPRRTYWTSSPSGGDEPNGENAGDCHWWHKAFMSTDLNKRIRHQTFDECRARFVSEYGIIGPCHIDSIREYLKPEEIRFDSMAWGVHTNTIEAGTVTPAIQHHYVDTDTLSIDDYVLYGQMFQAVLHGNAMEALRFRKCDLANDCQGALIWSYSDCWGETGWSILDYYLRRKASYYWFKRACAPLKVIVRQRGDKLVTRVVNDTLGAFTKTVRTGWWRLDGAEQFVETHTVDLPANSMVEVADAQIPPPSERDPSQWLYAAVLIDETGAAVDQSVWTFVPHRELAMAAPHISVQPCGDFGLEVSSPVYCHAAHTEDHGKELLSDNWFDLIPGIPVRVTIGARPDIAGIRFEAFGSG